MKSKPETPTNFLESITQTPSPPSMLTRSRAHAASSPSSSIISLKGTNNRQYGGKIVKPIAVRASPTSTQALSTTSTNKSLKTMSKNLLATTATATTNDFKNDNFSLIAKYFASFPATRLKPFQIPSKTTCNQVTIDNNQVRDGVCNQFNGNNGDFCQNFKKIIKINDQADDCASSRLGQITMETRSTRKFLIKHHPYLLTSNDLTMNVSNNQRVLRKRPSINFIKMKKSNSYVRSPTTTTTTTTTNISRSPTPTRITPPIITNEIVLEDELSNSSQELMSTLKMVDNGGCVASGRNLTSYNSKSSFNDADSGYQSSTLSSSMKNLNEIPNFTNKCCTSSKCCRLFSFSSAASSCTCDLDLDQIEND